jgi:hypothetical protein
VENTLEEKKTVEVVIDELLERISSAIRQNTSEDVHCLTLALKELADVRTKIPK